MHYQINPALTVRYEPNANRLNIGLTPIKGLSIEEDTAQLVQSIFQIMRIPMHLAEVSERLSKQATIDLEVSTFVLNQLISLGVLQPTLDRSHRYSRHQLYFSFSDIAYPTSVDVLRKKKIVLIGAGGIGSSCAMLLAAAGIGQLTLIDSDRIEASNLSRTILFEEKDIGQLKVNVCKMRLQARNSEIQIQGVSESLNENNLAALLPHFDGADFIILSADSGLEVHELTQTIATKLQIPYLNAGYVETFGVVGPTVLPKNSAIVKKDMQSEAGQLMRLPELNPSFQAPSYGPLNMLVSSIAVNEAIRHCLDLPIETAGQRLIIDSFTYSIQKENFLAE